jgi:hypothetical protein
MRDHNDIFNNKIRTFILVTIDSIVRRSLTGDYLEPDTRKAETIPTSILSNPQEFETRFRKIYSTLFNEVSEGVK